MSLANVNNHPLLITGDGQGVNKLSCQTVWDQFDAHGAVLFRDFDTDMDGFHRFASGFNHQFLMSPFGDRRTINPDNALQTVTLGHGRLDLHFEYGNSPMRPDVLWFYCRKAPAAGTGGETLVADGAGILTRLDEATRKALCKRRIKYVNYLPRPAFEAFEDLLLGRQMGTGIMDMLRARHNFRIREKNDLRVVFEFCVPAAMPLQPDGPMAICQNMFTDAYMKPDDAHAATAFATQVTWADDSAIEPSITEELIQVATSSTQEIQWQTGDFVMIDNNRFLHGRNQTRDPQRDLVMLSSFSNRFVRLLQAA